MPATSDAQQIDYNSSVTASRGTFVFSEATTSWAFDQGLTVHASRWRFGASVPLIFQNSSALTYIGGIPLPTGGPGAAAVRGRTTGTTVPMRGRRDTLAAPGSALVESPGAMSLEVGDPVVHAAWNVALADRSRVRMGVKALAKIPVADPSSGVGTGEFDSGVGVDVSVITARAFFYADATHWWLGDMPDLPLGDLTTVAMGLGRSLDGRGRVSALATITAATALVDNLDPPVALGLSLGIAVAERRYVTLSGAAGLTESAPDWAVSVGWRVSLTRSP
ncbi:MAG: hypothetical protein IT357_13355 [Gemmatimonadaceae bacterium]|nr:hypothetical protein [Gemmatimonadaceae bacterium]